MSKIHFFSLIKYFLVWKILSPIFFHLCVLWFFTILLVKMSTYSAKCNSLFKNILHFTQLFLFVDMNLGGLKGMWVVRWNKKTTHNWVLSVAFQENFLYSLIIIFYIYPIFLCFHFIFVIIKKLLLDILTRIFFWHTQYSKGFSL